LTILTFIAVNLLIFAGWYLWLRASRDNTVGDRIVYAGLLAAAQIVAAELLFGNIGMLHRTALVTTHVAIGVGLLARVATIRGRSAARVDRRFAAGLPELLAPANCALALLAGLLTVWVCVAAWFLPPRGIDDLVAHLPPVYQYAQDGAISLLPIKLRDQFAMPMNGEFLFLWPLVFFHADTFIDLVQYVVCLYGCAVLYALARRFDVDRRDAAFVGLLFLFTPLALGQAGSNYVDLIVAVCYLTLIYACVAYWQTGAVLHLAMAGIATGFGLGVKYNMLVAVIAVQPMIFLRLWRDRSPRRALAQYSLYALLSLPLCVFWYARNYLATGYPLFPFQLTIKGLSVVPWATTVNFPGNNFTGSPVKAIADFLQRPLEFSLMYVFQDPGLGSFHGGFGPVFWGLCLPALVYCFCKALGAARRRDYFPALFWGQVPLTFLVYFVQIQTQRLEFNQRLILVVVAFGLLALGIVLVRLRKAYPGSAPVLRSSGVLAAVLAVVHLAGYGWPSYRITEPVADRSGGTLTSDYKYLRQAPGELSLLAAAWEPLDFLTRDGDGWAVYFAAPWTLSWTTPLFGSRIQNTVWGFQAEPHAPPDAYIFHRADEFEPFYLGERITPRQVWADHDFEIVTQTPTTQFWASSRLLRLPETRVRLVAWYERAFHSDIAALEPVIERLPRDALLITASSLGHGLKYLHLTGELGTAIRIVPEGMVAPEASRSRAERIITIGEPLTRYESRPLLTLRTTAGAVVFYENRVR
jgi:hypothetical protein